MKTYLVEFASCNSIGLTWLTAQPSLSKDTRYDDRTWNDILLSNPPRIRMLFYLGIGHTENIVRYFSSGISIGVHSSAGPLCLLISRYSMLLVYFLKAGLTRPRNT